MLCSEPTEGARQARRSDLALNRVGTLSFLPSPGATSHPETPTRTLGWGSERPAVGSICQQQLALATPHPLPACLYNSLSSPLGRLTQAVLRPLGAIRGTPGRV